MTHCINKINLNRILLLIFSGIVFLNLGQPYAEESTQPIPPLIVLQQNKQPDPLIPLNVSFRKTYSDLRKQILTTNDPIIVQVSDKIVLLKNGTRTESKAFSNRYTELKSLAHIPLAIYVMLVTGTDSVIDKVQLDKLRDYRALIEPVSASISSRNFSSEQRDRQLRIINGSLSIIETALINRLISKAALHQFTLSQRQDTLANIYDAAEDQINTIQQQVDIWLKEMTPEEKQHLRVVVGASHMPRTGNLAMQYFSVILGEPYEGRYEVEGDNRDNSFRLIYGENIFDEESALRLLGTHLIDADIGTYFFNDSQRMHRDLLADATEEIIRKKRLLKQLKPIQ